MQTLRHNYRIYLPAGTLGQRMRRTIGRGMGTCRFVQNRFIQAYKVTTNEGKTFDFDQTYTEISRDLKKQPGFEWVGNTSSVAIQQALNDTKKAYFDHFASLKGKGAICVKEPRFQGKTGPQSMRFTKAAFSLKGKDLYLAGIGTVYVRWSRELPSPPSSATLILDTDGTLHVSFVVTQDVQPHPTTQKDCGVDVGFRKLAVISSADASGVVEHRVVPRLQQAVNAVEKRQKRLEKRLNRKQGPDRRKKQRASKNWKKERAKLSKIQTKGRRIRQDILHKVSSDIVRQHDVIVIETLNVKAMARKGNKTPKTGPPVTPQKARRYGKSIGYNPVGGLLSLIEEKAKRYGRTLVKADTFYPSSKTCSYCMAVNSALKREERWTCPSCGGEHDRDGNAASVLLRLPGRMAVPRDTRELMAWTPRKGRPRCAQVRRQRHHLRAVKAVGVGHGGATTNGNVVKSRKIP